MCGITFIFDSIGLKINDAAAQKSLRSLQLRGPDQSNTYIENYFYAGATRLILTGDKFQGSQPCKSYSGKSVLLYNGEIYNYKELSKMYFNNLTIESDTQFLVEFLETFRFSKLHELNGMFSLVFIDLSNKSFFAARDRLGIKPLFYRKEGSSFHFASTIASLIELNKSVTINQNSIQSIKLFRTPPIGKTIYDEISELPAGSIYDPTNTPEIINWWKISDYYDDHKVEDDLVQDLLDDSIQLRSHLKLPMALFSSGGIDSFLIGRKALHSKSLLFQEAAQKADFETNNSVFLERISGLRPMYFQTSKESLNQRKTEFILRNLSLVPVENTLIIELMAEWLSQNNFRLVYSGDGADELFLGYERISSRFLSSELTIDAFLREYFYCKCEFNISGHPPTEILKRDFGMTSDDMRSKETFLKWFWIKVHLRPLLHRLDVGTANFSVEARSPFLDFRLLHYALSLRSDGIVENGFGKMPLRRLAFKHGHLKALTNVKRAFTTGKNSVFTNMNDEIDQQSRILDSIFS
jgi:asparagine synthase (glutamine-hydrolysing)